MLVNHQFLNQPWFLPNWECKTLIIGSFNPECGEQTDYFYGRNRNRFWRALAHLQVQPQDYFFHIQEGFARKLTHLQNSKLGCADMIRSVKVQDHFVPKICGNGYTDQNLFNVANVSRQYNTSLIITRLEKGDVLNVVIALGARNSPVDYLIEKQRLIQYCENQGITVFDDGISFSPRGGRTVADIAEYLNQFIGEV